MFTDIQAFLYNSSSFEYPLEVSVLEWTKRERELWQEIEHWENEFFTYDQSYLEKNGGAWFSDTLANLNPAIQKKIMETLENTLFQVHSVLQSSGLQKEAKDRILMSAKVFDESMNELSDLRTCRIDQLIYIAEQQIARQRVLSLAQGGLSGTGGLLFLGLDIPATVVMQLRSIQLIAMSYGYDSSEPYEMMLALRAFHTSILPKHLQKESWSKLEEEIEQLERDRYFFETDALISEASWLTHLTSQLGKGITIYMLRKRFIQGIPMLGMLFGAGANYQLSRKVTKMAHRFYQKRFLIDKLKEGV
jgi:hypothetical protein